MRAYRSESRVPPYPLAQLVGIFPYLLVVEARRPFTAGDLGQWVRVLQKHAQKHSVATMPSRSLETCSDSALFTFLEAFVAEDIQLCCKTLPVEGFLSACEATRDPLPDRS